MAAKSLRHQLPEDKNRFVLELPLGTTPADEAEIEIRIQAYNEIKNACLGEALRRLDLMRQSKEHQAARKLPRGGRGTAEQTARTKAFRAIAEHFKFNEYDLHAFAASCKNSCWIGNHLGINEVQKACSEAFRSVEQYSSGKKGRPRFKSARRARSVEGKSNSTGVRWREDRVLWGGLSLPAIFHKKDTDGYQAQALACETALCRIIRRIEKGRNRYFVQLVQKGKPPTKAKNTVGKQSVCVDVGPSSAAVVGETQAGLFHLAPSVIEPWKEVRRIQRG